MKYLDPLLLAKIKNITIRPKVAASGMFLGRHKGVMRGHSLEFAQHREYSSGDEPRRIDWKIFGRSDKYFVRLYQNETNLRGYILLDASASMNFSSKSDLPSKFEYSKSIAAAISFILLKQEDYVSLAAFDSSVIFQLPQRNVMPHMTLIDDSLSALRASGKSSIHSALDSFATSLSKRGMALLISDMFGDAEKIIKSLKFYKSRHNDVSVIHVLDPMELDLSFAGEVLFRDIEDLTEVFAVPDTVREEYCKAIIERIESFRTAFRTAGISYAVVTTDMDHKSALSKILS